MRVPLTVNDFLYRAEAVSADAVAVVDEPVQPAAPVRTTTYADLLTRIRAWQAGLDEMHRVAKPAGRAGRARRRRE